MEYWNFFSLSIDEERAVLVGECFHDMKLVDTDLLSNPQPKSEVEAEAVRRNKAKVALGTHISCLYLRERLKDATKKAA